MFVKHNNDKTGYAAHLCRVVKHNCIPSLHSRNGPNDGECPIELNDCVVTFAETSIRYHYLNLFYMILHARSSFLRKFFTCFVAGLTAVAWLLMLGNGGNVSWLPPEMVFPLAGIFLLFSIIFPMYWQLREKPDHLENSGKIYMCIHELIRYCLAFNIASFGWKKIFGLQFIVPKEIASIPMNEQSGEWLTWFYFGHSSAFATIIAMVQLTGALLLLFTRTQLLALFILFAFMMNLTLINIFYQMNAGALLQSVIITLSLLFLLSLNYRKIIEFFFAGRSRHTDSSTVKNIIRVSAIVLSLLFTVYLKTL